MSRKTCCPHMPEEKVYKEDICCVKRKLSLQAAYFVQESVSNRQEVSLLSMSCATHDQILHLCLIHELFTLKSVIQ